MSQEKPKHAERVRSNPNRPRKRIRHKRPAQLAALIKKKLEDRNWTYRILEEHTRDIDPDGEGVAWSITGSVIRGETQEPRLRHLWLMAQAFGDTTLGDLLLAMGYEPSDIKTTPETAGRQRLLTMIRGATDEDLMRVERVLRLSEAEKRTLDVTLDVMQKCPAG